MFSYFISLNLFRIGTKKLIISVQVIEIQFFLLLKAAEFEFRIGFLIFEKTPFNLCQREYEIRWELQKINLVEVYYLIKIGMSSYSFSNSYEIKHSTTCTENMICHSINITHAWRWCQIFSFIFKIFISWFSRCKALRFF